MDPSRPRGTPGITPRQSIGCAIAAGRKDTRGNPTDTHRFFIVQPHAEGQGREAVRRMHPAYAAFNALAPVFSEPPPNPDMFRDRGEFEERKAAWEAKKLEVSAKAAVHDDMRTTIKGILVHTDADDAYWDNFKAQKIQGHMHPKGAPSCEGNGDIARRWFNNPDGSGAYREIPCPGDRCQYREGKPRPPCLPFGMVLFQLRFDKSPALLAKYSSNGAEAIGAIKGFFNGIAEQARALGVMNPSYYGIPLVMTLSKRTKQAAPGERFGSRWYVPSFSTDFPDGMTLAEFLLASAEKRRQLVGANLQIGTLATAREVLDEELEIITHNAGSIGGSHT